MNLFSAEHSVGYYTVLSRFTIQCPIDGVLRSRYACPGFDTHVHIFRGAIGASKMPCSSDE